MDERFIAFFLWVNSAKIPLTILLKNGAVALTTNKTAPNVKETGRQ